MKDYYDLYYLITYKEFSEENLKQAITKTFDKRNTSLNDIETTLSMISKSSFTKDLWKNYAKKHKYTANIKFEEIIDTISSINYYLSNTDYIKKLYKINTNQFPK